MNGKHLTLALAAPVLGIVLLTTGCDDMLNMTPPGFNFPHDPYPIYTIINSTLTSAQLIRIQFNKFGMGFKLFGSNVILPGPQSSFRVGRLGGGTLDPDPDEHFMCPDLWPDPDDEFPLPDPPLPMPDYPDEDPFDGLPEPPPFPDDMLPITDLSDGDVTIVNTGGTDRGLPGAGRESTVTGHIIVGAQPAGIAGTYDRKYIAVANLGSDSISLIQNGAVTATIRLPGGTRPFALAFSPDDSRLYVTSWVRSGGHLVVVDVASQQVIASVTTGNFPSGIAVMPDGSQVWVTSFFNDSVTVVDTLSNTVAFSISGVLNAWGIAFNITGTRAFVANADTVAGGLTAIDTATYKVIKRIPTGDGSRTVAVSPTGRHVFVTNRNGNTVSQIDARGLTLIRNIVVGPNPEGLQMVK